MSSLTLHGRIRGAAIRALALSAGLFPIDLALRLRAHDVVALHVVALLIGGLVFLLEERDAPTPSVLARAAAGGALGIALVPVTAVCAVNAGDPTRMLDGLARLTGEAGPVAAACGTCALLSPAWALVLVVRSRTRRAWPQVLAGGLTAVALVALLVIVGQPWYWELPEPFPRWVAALLACGPIAAGAVAVVDRWQTKVDPRGAAPTVERGVVATFVQWVPMAVAALGLCTPVLLVSRTGHRPSNESCAIGSLKSISQAQALFALKDADDDGRPDFAGSLDELVAHSSRSCARLVDGVWHGYVFRLARDELESERRWCATAEPVTPGTTGDRRFWVDQTGVLRYTSSPGSLILDPAGGPPAGWILLGK